MKSSNLELTGVTNVDGKGVRTHCFAKGQMGQNCFVEMVLLQGLWFANYS